MNLDIFIYKTLELEKNKLLPLLDEQGCVVVTTLVSGRHGVHITEILFDILKVEDEDPESEWAYETVDRLLDSLTDELVRHFSDDNWWVGFNETDGDIDVFYGTCKET